MGNKLGSSSPQGSLRTSKLRNENGSSESLSTIVSLNSHAERCLIPKSYSCTLDGTKMKSCKDNRKHEESIDDTSTEITSLDDLSVHQEDRSRVHESQEKVIIPERLLKKLTTEDWNDLVHFICSSMEHSLQSNILKTLEELREMKMDLNSPGDSSEEGMNKTESVDARQENQKLDSSSELDSNYIKPRRHTRTIRPVSMPPDSLHLPDNGECMMRNHHRHHHRRTRHHRADSKSPPLDISLDENSQNAGVQRKRASSNPHKVRFVDSRLTRSCSGTSIDELGIKSACKSIERRNGYLTLEQLKELGLSLRQDTSKTFEGLSSFSMKCWHGDPDHHLTQNKRRPRRRHSKRSSVNKLCKNKENDISMQKQQPQFEQLCLLGPSVPSSPCPSPSNTDNDRGSPVKDSGSDPDESGSGVKVEHLHQHSHHHFHHFIHHSVSQPSDLCAGATYQKPVHYIISESQ